MIGQWNPFLTFRNLLQNALAGSDQVSHVSAQSALSYAPIWYGVSKISGHIAQLPVSVFRRLPDGGSEKMRMHPVTQLMRKPNAYQTSLVFRQNLATHAILQGNGRAAIVRQASRINELIPLHPDCTATGMLAGQKVHATRPSRDDRLRLFFDTIDGDDDGVIALDDEQVVHVPGLSLDGVCGLPLIEAARRNLAISLNMERRLDGQMESGFQGNIMLQAPQGVFRKQKDAEEYLNWFEKRHHDKEKTGKPGLLREGITAQMLAMNNTDAQFSEQRILQRQDAALWLGLEAILGDDNSVSYNSIEQKTLAYLCNTLNLWLKKTEEELEYKLLSARQFTAGDYFIRFNTAALLKSDYKTTIESLSTAVTSTILSRNEAREVLDRNPVDGGDDFANPAITPGQQSDPDDEPDEEEQQALPSEAEAARQAIRSHLQHLIGVEAKRVTAAAEKHQDYASWLGWFYDGWREKLAGWLEHSNLDPDLAEGHCEQSKRQLMEASVAENRVEAVTSVVAKWPDRADHLMEADTHVCS